LISLVINTKEIKKPPKVETKKNDEYKPPEKPKPPPKPMYVGGKSKPAAPVAPPAPAPEMSDDAVTEEEDADKKYAEALKEYKKALSIDDDDVKVVIDFNKDGKVVIKTIEPENSREGVLPFIQALYMPWLGFFVSSSSVTDDRSKAVRFAQTLLFPWAGVFFPKEQSTTNEETDDDNDNNKVVDPKESEKGNNGVLPFVKALFVPWIGIFQRK